MPKTIEQIYDEYKVMHSLREHMYRVASVASILCDHISVPVDRKSILQTCLLHDMANIIKSDLKQFPDFTKPEGEEYWQKVKDEYVAKYGEGPKNTHLAILKIAEEVGASLRSLELLNAGGFDNALYVLKSNEFEKKICFYADMRASPRSVVSLSERLDDFSQRYKLDSDPSKKEDFEEKVKNIHQIEKQIFEKINIAPSFIDEKNVQNIIPHLKSLHIH